MALIFLFLILFSSTKAEMDYVLDTNIGRFHGIVESVHFNGSTKQVVKFLGIPFAKPPIGILRFKKPIPRTNLTGDYNATFYRPPCPQPLLPNQSFITSEDCLYLNVFVPFKAFEEQTGNLHNESLRAVMVWIYGGGYIVGRTELYDGGILSSFHDVVMVSVSYRVGIFGFFSTHNAASPGNYGLWDQHLAIRWVHDNIRAFMGDSNRVTIFGESAGSGSVLQQALFSGNKGLFKNVIAESGAPLSPWAFSKPGEYMDKYTQTLASLSGCKHLWNRGLVDCLRSKPAQDIIDKMADVDNNLEGVRNLFSPVVDGDFFKIPPIEIFQNTHVEAREYMLFFRSLNVMTGINSDDGALFLSRLPAWGISDPTNGLTRDIFETKEVPLVVNGLFDLNSTILQRALIQQYTNWVDPNNASAVLLKFIDLETDIEFLLPAVRALNAHVVLNSATSTYFYVFSHKPSTTNISYMNGANHGEELPFLLGIPPNLANLITGPRKNVPQDEITLSKLLMTMWTNFAKTG